MDDSNLKNKVVKGTFWVLFERMSGHAVQFVVGMILARLLTPTDYGTVALTAIFFSVVGVLVDGGFGGALIQKKDADDLDFNSVFYLNVITSIVGYLTLFFAAPFIAEFYNTPILTRIVRVSALSVLFSSIGVIPSVTLTKKMRFRLSFKISIARTITFAVVGVVLAFLRYGVWALVYASLLSSLVDVFFSWFIVAWRPRPVFSFARLKPLFSYGWKMSASSLLDAFFHNLDGLLIGKFYSRADLAFVNKGKSLPVMLVAEVDGTINRVSFPALVSMQDDRLALRETMRRMMICSSFLVFPLMVGVAACAKSELLLLYGQTWVEAAPYMMLSCFSLALRPFHTINLKGIMALGRSDIFFKLEIIKKAARLVFILLFIRHGVFAFMCACAFALGPLSVLINAWPNKKLLNYSIKMQIMDVFPTIAVCAAEAAVVFSIDIFMNLMVDQSFLRGGHLAFWLALKLMLQFAFGALTFFLLSYVFRLRAMNEYVRIAAPAIRWVLPRLERILSARFQ